MHENEKIYEIRIALTKKIVVKNRNIIKILIEMDMR